MTSLKLYARNGSTQAPGCAPDAGAAGGVAAGSATCASFSFDLHATGVLADAEDHELSGLDGCDADDRDDHPGVDHVGRVRLVVALDEERFAGGPAHERAVAPHAGQERAHVWRDGALMGRTTGEAF